MKALTLLSIYFLLFPVMLSAQSFDEMSRKVSAAIDAGQESMAVSYFRQTIDVDIDRTEMYYWTSIKKNTELSQKLAKELAVAYKSRRMYNKAYLFYKELLQNDPNNISYLLECGDMDVERGHEKEALKIYERVLQLAPDNLAANIFVGNYYFLMAERRKNQLDNDYKKIATPNRMQYARYRDGLHELFTSSYQKARESLTKVIQQFPSTEAKKTIDKILSIEKEVNR